MFWISAVSICNCSELWRNFVVGARPTGDYMGGDWYQWKEERRLFKVVCVVGANPRRGEGEMEEKESADKWGWRLWLKDDEQCNLPLGFAYFILNKCVILRLSLILSNSSLTKFWTLLSISKLKIGKESIRVWTKLNMYLGNQFQRFNYPLKHSIFRFHS